MGVTQVQPGYALWSWKFKVLGQSSTSVITCATEWGGGNITDTDLSAVAGAMVAPGMLLSLGQMTTKGTFVECAGLANDGGTLYSKVQEANNPGTISAFNPPPPNTTVVVSKVTSFAGRKYRGRMLVPPLLLAPGQYDTAGVIDPDVLDDLQTRADATFNALLAASVGPALFHHATVAAPHPTPTTINNFLVRPVLGTDRRRIRQR